MIMTTIESKECRDIAKSDSKEVLLLANQEDFTIVTFASEKFDTTHEIDEKHKNQASRKGKKKSLHLMLSKEFHGTTTATLL